MCFIASALSKISLLQCPKVTKLQSMIYSLSSLKNQAQILNLYSTTTTSSGDAISTCYEIQLGLMGNKSSWYCYPHSTLRTHWYYSTSSNTCLDMPFASILISSSEILPCQLLKASRSQKMLCAKQLVNITVCPSTH